MTHLQKAWIGIATTGLCLLLASGVHAEIWDKQLRSSDFDKFEERCATDAEILAELRSSLKEGAYLVAPIKIQRFDGKCFAFRGACTADNRAVLFDEHAVSWTWCAIPFRNRECVQVKAEGSGVTDPRR